MDLILKLSIRNLIRQKRRNILLGTGIAIGMMLLVIANSFSHGLVDVLINDIVAHAYGHIVIEGNPNNLYTMISDKEKVLDIINETIPGNELIYVMENLGIYAQAVGNGEADSIMLIGVDIEDEELRKEFFEDFFILVEGNYDEYLSEDIQYPIIISENKAKSLNVGLYDVIRIRFPMITGQIQTANLTVIAIANAANSFMDIATFMDASRVKELAGYKPWEAASLQITLRNPKKSAYKYADLLHKNLQPGVISIVGDILGEETRLLAYKNNEQGKNIIRENIEIISGDIEKVFNKSGVLISSVAAEKLGLQVEDEITFTYQSKYLGPYSEKFIINAIYEAENRLGEMVVLVNEERIHSSYNNYLPAEIDWDYINKNTNLYEAMATEWKLLERSTDSRELMKKYLEERKTKTNQNIIDVVTMYEGASDIMMLEGVMNLVTVLAIMVLFLIILIGVINSLRMTIKERTREIGTVRAIGMQRKDIKRQFITETIILTLSACLIGIIVGIILSYGLSLLELDLDSALSMILKDGHLNFKINLPAIGSNLFIILLIAVFTAYFPARKAARMSAIEALRHY